MRAEVLKGHLDGLLLSVLELGPIHGYAVIESLRARSGGAFDLPTGTVVSGVASSRAGRPGPGILVLGHGAAPAGVRTDDRRPSGPGRPAGVVVAVRRGGVHGDGRRRRSGMDALT